MKFKHKTTVTLTEEEIKAIETIQRILNDDIDYSDFEGWLDFDRNSYGYEDLRLIDNFLIDLLNANEG